MKVMIAAVIVVVALSATSACSAAPKEESTPGGAQGKQDAEQVLQQVFTVNEFEWSGAERDAAPAKAECTAANDPHGGQQNHWNAMGSAPSDPKAYIEAVTKMLREHDRTVTVRSVDGGEYGTLYQAIADDDGKPEVAVTANPRTTTVTVESVCEPVGSES